MKLTGVLVQAFLCLLIIFGSLLVAGLLTNKLPWSEPPGIFTRLFAYLTVNEAETEVGSIFPELRPQVYAAPAALMFDVGRRAVERLGWETLTVDPDDRKIEAVVTTKIFGFKDDLLLWVEVIDEQHSQLFARSASRVGKGDLGANTRHLMNLFAMVEATAPVSAVAIGGVESSPGNSSVVE